MRMRCGSLGGLSLLVAVLVVVGARDVEELVQEAGAPTMLNGGDSPTKKGGYATQGLPPGARYGLPGYGWLKKVGTGDFRSGELGTYTMAYCRYTCLPSPHHTLYPQ